MPRPGITDAERSARILMTYFHPFTLRPNDASNNVPHVCNLRQQHESWQDAVVDWFDGKVLCQEAKRYIDNFLCVTRARPGDAEDEDHNSDDICSDEELCVTKDMLDAVLATNVARRKNGRSAEADDVPSASEVGIKFGQAVWAPRHSVPSNLKEFDGATYSKETIQHMFRSAKSGGPLTEKDKASCGTQYCAKNNQSPRKMSGAGWKV